MKINKLTLTAALTLTFAPVVSQNASFIRGRIFATGGSAISVQIAVDPGTPNAQNIASTTTADGFIYHAINVANPTGSYEISYTDCQSVSVSKQYTYKASPILDTLANPFFLLSFCDTGCQAYFTKSQALDPITNVPIANEIVITDHATMMQGPIKYYWYFGDGMLTNASNPTHHYATNGPFELCQVIYSSPGFPECADYYCDSIEIDSSGILKSMGFNITVEKPLWASINESNQEVRPLVFPNPVDDVLNIEFQSGFGKGFSIELYSSSGQIILKREVQENNDVIDFSQLKSGRYILRILREENVFINNIVKTN